MTNSKLTINGKRLAARWGIETIDLMYIIFNHDLNVIHPSHEGSMALNDIFDIFCSDRDLSDFVYRLSEVKNIETELGIEGKIPLSEFIRGKDLMIRWEMNSSQVYMIMSDLGLEAIDPFRHEIGNDFLFPLITSNTLYVWDLLFRLSDIEDLESEYDDLEPILQAQDKNSGTDKIESIPDNEKESISVISLYKNGDSWLIGEKGKEKTINHLKGFDLISFLIRNEGKEIDVNVLYDLGEISTEDSKLNVGNVPDGIKILPQEALEMTYIEGDEKKYSLYNTSVQYIVDRQTIEETENEIKFLKKQLLMETDPEKKIQLKEAINDIQQYIKEAKRSPGTISKFKDTLKDRVRSNVQKRIKTALDKISKIPKINKILHKNNIKTGFTCCYKPDPSNPVKWILDPED